MRIFLISLVLVFTACKEATVEGDFHYVYLNWNAEDTSSTIQINVATTKEFPNWNLLVKETKSQIVIYDKTEKSNTNKYLKGAHYLHIPLADLKANTSYEFQLSSVDYQGPVYKFKTLPKKLDRPLRFIVGGDTGHGEKFGRLAELSKTYDFDFAVFGGDIAYADGDVTKYKNWVDWLEKWTKASNHKGYLKPFIVAIGNHETNYVNFFNGRRARAPFFYGLFAQDQNTFFRRNIAGQNFIILDTGHIATYGSQKEWLAENLNKEKNWHQFTFYHIPFFPAHRSFDGQARIGRDAWMNIMESGGVDISFEHHDHVLKRTYPLKDKQVNLEDGIIYLGDGAMGKSTRELNNEWYLEHSQSENHFWMVDMSVEKLDVQAIGFGGQVLDQFQIKN
ncbi:MAG: metallophosphoesterase [Bdellovibrionales bacterium]